MEENFESLLAENEKLLFTVRPEHFETLDKTNRNSIVMGVIIKAVVTAILLVLYLLTALNAGSVNVAVFIVILAVAAYAIANPFLVARRLRDKTLYGLTDKHILRSGSNAGAVPYDRIKHAVLRTDEDGHTTLLCGESTNLKPTKWRLEADAAFINEMDNEEADRVILYAIPMNAELKAFLKEKLPLA